MQRKHGTPVTATAALEAKLAELRRREIVDISRDLCIHILECDGCELCTDVERYLPAGGPAMPALRRQMRATFA